MPPALAQALFVQGSKPEDRLRLGLSSLYRARVLAPAFRCAPRSRVPRAHVDRAIEQVTRVFHPEGRVTEATGAVPKPQ